MMFEYKEIVGRCYYIVIGIYFEEDMIEKIILSGVGEGKILSRVI